jgi:hypothetical protein
MKILDVIMLIVVFHKFLGESDGPVRSFVLVGEPAVIFVVTLLSAVCADMILMLVDPVTGFLASCIGFGILGVVFVTIASIAIPCIGALLASLLSVDPVCRG